MRKISYIAIVKENCDGFSVYFPDLDGCVSWGKTFEESVVNAKEALELHIFGCEEDGIKLPEPSFDVSRFEKGELVTVVTAYPDIFKDEYYNRRVKTNITIPYGLKELAEKRKINFSRLLESALREVLGIKTM